MSSWTLPAPPFLGFARCVPSRLPASSAATATAAMYGAASAASGSKAAVWGTRALGFLVK